jgi:hypothetical protein
MSNISSNSSLEPISNVTTLLSLNELLAQLGFETWQTVINTFILPPINLIGIVCCSFSLWIFFRSSFSDPIFFYYKLLCFLNIQSLLLNIPFGILISPLYFPWINTYACSIYQILYGSLSTFLFHFEDVIQMGILLHKMKRFSPFVRDHFRASPQLVSLAFFLTCVFIDFPLFFGSKISPLGDYFYLDSNGVRHTKTLYFFTISDFSLTYFGQFLFGFATFFLNLFLSLLVGVILNVSSFIKYKSHVNIKKQEVEQLQNSSINNRPTTNREIIQMSLREKAERKIEKNMFYMALTLSSISFLSRLFLMICYLYYFIFSSFSNSLLILLIANFIYTFGPTFSIFIFYSFNQMFRDQTNKKVFCVQPRPSPRVIFISNDVRF